MARCKSAIIMAFTSVFLSAPAFAKASVPSVVPVKRATTIIETTRTDQQNSVKKETAVKSNAADAVETQSQTEDNINPDSVRTEPAVIQQDDQMPLPQGALYTTSDDCA